MSDDAPDDSAWLIAALARRQQQQQRLVASQNADVVVPRTTVWPRWQQLFAAGISTTSASASVKVGPPPDSGEAAPVFPSVEILLQTEIIVPGDRTTEGLLIEGVSVIWFEILRKTLKDPDFLHKLNGRQFEKFLAGTYEQAGWESVILTPASGDGGIDVIATRKEFGSLRFIDQAKAFAANRVVTANDVRAFAFKVAKRGDVTKGFITTTSSFAPEILKDADIAELIPHRLILRSHDEFLAWLAEIAKEKGIRP